MIIAAFSLAIATGIGVFPTLRFDVKQVDGKNVLVAYNCSGFDGLDEDRDCEPWELMVRGAGRYRKRNGSVVPYAGDARELDTRLQRARGSYDEVWLLTGGGDLEEGILMGRVLRRHRVTVRVPSTARVGTSKGGSYPLVAGGFCASSCTVAFLGGLFRYVDPGSRFVVHSASSFKNAASDSLRASFARGEFDALVGAERMISCQLGLQMMRHFQNGLLLLVRLPQQPEDDEYIRRTITAKCPPPTWYTPDEARRFKQQYTLEGSGAAQDIAMRIERGSMLSVVAWLKRDVATLGPRAAPAIRMLEAMYDVTIVGGAGLSPETLLQMGYVTQLIDDR